MIYAAIDVGTNSVKLVVADLNGGGAECVYEQAATTRLGEGMHAQAQRLREVPMRRTIDTICDLVEAAHAHQAERIVAAGTAALREAENRDEFLRRVQERCGLTVEVISGEEEAWLSYLAVRRDPLWRDCIRLLVIDVGGGSTEVIEGALHSDRIAARFSVSQGAVRLTERYLKSDPATISQLAAANQAAAEGFRTVQIESHPGPLTVVGVGGTLTNLAAMDRHGASELEALHGHVLTVDHLEAQITELAARTVEERKAIPGLDPRRADIILGGAILLSQALARIGVGSLMVSTRGLRWGLLFDRFLEWR